MNALGEPIGATIGEAIKGPYIFFKHNMKSEEGEESYFRRHWHSGEGRTPNGLKTIMNYWNSQLDQISTAGTAAAPNGFTVTKTIYDPCPAGYHIPAPNAFAAFGPKAGSTKFSEINSPYKIENVFDPETNKYRIGWNAFPERDRRRVPRFSFRRPSARHGTLILSQNRIRPFPRVGIKIRHGLHSLM